MALASFMEFLIFSSLLLLSLTYAQPSFRPDALILPVRKDASTLQYLTVIDQRTPLVPVNLVVDLGGESMWVNCESNYSSSTFRQARCRSAQCSLAGGNGCDTENICGGGFENSVIRVGTYGAVVQDVLSMTSTDGSNPGPVVMVPRFIFFCARTFILRGLASGAVGMAGLGRTRVALPSQLASAFSFHRKFAICLSSSTSSNGVVFFGDGPYNLLPNVDASGLLTYTPLFAAPEYEGGPLTGQYYIGVRSIRINENVVPLNTSLLSVNRAGIGGTRISTVDPYTIMETSIYNAFTRSFINVASAMNITRVASVAPFSACFNSNNIPSTRLGLAVPSIGLVLQNERVIWRITGSNSLVQVSDNVVCLGFVDGGAEARTSIVIGGQQLEDNLLQFDLASSRLGFSSTLLGARTTCSNFNFTSNP